MKKITILDYGLGNVRSLKNSLKIISSNVSYFSENPKINFDILFIPGVGSFSKASEILFDKNFSNLILESNKNGILIVGICLGMHILLTKGYEDGESKGLNLIRGNVDKIPVKSKKLPNIGWHDVSFSENKQFNFSRKFDNSKFYFVHSYMSNVENKNNIISYIDYDDIKIPSIIYDKNVLGIQFHPEKSGENGIEFLREIIREC